MKKSNVYPQDQIFWSLKKKSYKNLVNDIKTDVVVIGGGMAGLSAAQSFMEKGCSVVLLEKYFCGAGASGKSSGFITPYSELGLQFFAKEFGAECAKKVWDFGTSGVELIRSTIEQYSIQCDFQKQDVLVVANAAKKYKELEKDHAINQALSTESMLYTQEQLPSFLGSDSYYGAIRYPHTFGINVYDYCQAVKEILQSRGVFIFEDTPALSIDADTVHTPYGKVIADHIIVCMDRYMPDLNILADKVFPVQTFLMISEPLPEKDIQRMFPQGQFMLWDTDLIYTYFRLINNNRLLIGGSDYLAISWGHEQHNLQRMYKKLDTYVKTKFAYLSVKFSYMWPGLIGVSKDVIPLAGHDEKNKRVYSITCATGLPWAAALGRYSAERIVQGNREFDDFFSWSRKYPLGSVVQSLLGKKLTFSLSNFINLYFKN